MLSRVPSKMQFHPFVHLDLFITLFQYSSTTSYYNMDLDITQSCLESQMVIFHLCSILNNFFITWFHL